MAGVHAVHPLDLGAIDAIGFDLDHTLAVYDDARVNGLAYDETCDLLASVLGRRPAVPYDELEVCRGLLIDTLSGPVVKPDARGRVRRARSGGSWLSREEIDAAYRAPVDASPRFHAIHSPFDLPTAFFYQELGHTAGDFAGACNAIRRELDRTHTRGRFKGRVLDAVDSLIAPLPGGAQPFERLHAAGKRLFILTNSETHYTEAVLDRLFGDAWRGLFDAVLTEAGKPGFFLVADTPPLSGATDALLTAGSDAGRLEKRLGVESTRILYIGDSVVSDAAPARRRGWRTALVVPELREGGTGHWGSALFEGGYPTWFAAAIAASADIYAPGLDALLAGGPAARFAPRPRHPLAGECP